MGPIMPQLLVMRCVARGGRWVREWKNHGQRRSIFRCRQEKELKITS
jgi:peptidyl-tRNA hydrolase